MKSSKYGNPSNLISIIFKSPHLVRLKTSTNEVMKFEIPSVLVSSSISLFINKRTIKYVINPTSIEKLTPAIQLVSNSLEFLLNHSVILSCSLSTTINNIAKLIKAMIITMLNPS